MKNLQALWASRELLFMLVWRDISIRYKQSVMGFLWAILMPMLIVSAGALVRVGAAQLSGIPVKAEDISSVMVRAVVWAFIISSIRFGTNSLTGNTNLVSKIAFPKETFPIAATIASGMDFLVSLLALFTALLLIGWTPSWSIFWFVPLSLLAFSMTVGMAMFLSAANLFFRDVKYLVEIFLTYAIFFTPVLYEAKMMGKWSDILMLNPFAPLLESFSMVVVEGHNPNAGPLMYSVGVSLFVLIVGYRAFKRLESKFAESV